MVEDYTYIARNDVWDIMSILNGNPVVILRWIYNIKHVVDGSIKKFKVMFLVEIFPIKREWAMRIFLLQLLVMLIFKLLFIFLHL
jgi:hypothetical protein